MKFPVKSVADLGLLARATRRSNRLRLDDVAGSAGLGPVFVGDVEHGKETVQFGRVLRLLEELGIEIGIVTDVVGFGSGTVTFSGRADHAGTTPMARRKDALLGAAELVVALPGIAVGVSERAVVTCGFITVEPGGANVVPGSACMAVDFRDPSADHLAALESSIMENAKSIAAEHGLDVKIEFEGLAAPVPLDQDIQGIIAECARAAGLSSVSLPSGAGHDSQNMATLAPSGMIFVPSVGGRSHCPEENTLPQDIVNGANVLLDTLICLSTRQM